MNGCEKCHRMSVSAADHRREIQRLARLAAKSRESYAKYAGQLQEAKARLAADGDVRDLHLGDDHQESA